MRGRRRVTVALAVAASLVAVSPPTATATAPDGDLTSLVNPFIGTENEGNTFPGAAVPFGMVQLSPDTGHSTGYDYKDHHIRGFSTVHLSGVGCRIGGDLPVLPTTGEITQTDNARYAAEFSHKNETARPGYYRVRLGSYGGITAELTATTRTGRQRYTFPATEKANVLFNAGQSLHRAVSSSVQIVDNRTVRTTITGRGFCQDTRPYTLHTLTRFDRPFRAYGTWKDDQVTKNSRSSSAATGRNGAWVRFDTTDEREVEATTAISYVDAAGAERNLRAEEDDFDRTADAAQEAWEKRLRDVEVQGGGPTLRRTFYSSLYRSFLSPNVGSDTDGRYTGWDQRIHRTRGFTYYQNWSLWDTYRTQAQLLALLAPREARDMALSVLRVDAEGGWLPKWGYGTVETNIMTGDPVTPYLTNAFHHGLLSGHEEEAYRVLRRNADGVPPAGNPGVGREGNVQYLRNGFVPYLPDRPRAKPGDSDFHEGASATLEYALADGALARMARALGHREDARRYTARSRNYRTLFDRSTGFFRPRGADGAFTGSADPAKSPGFHEGTAWQYQWLVPQDLPGLVELIGGKDQADRRLDAFFAYDKLLADPARTAREVWVNGPYDYYNADKYNPQNEPDLIAPYTYLSTGRPWKTTDVVHAALTLFTDTPDGMTGNDDLGTMSAWMVLSAIGVYPVQPGADVWGLSTPVFERVDLRLDRRWYPRGRFTVSAPGTSRTDRYVRSVRLDGEAYDRTYVTTQAIREGERLDFRVGPRPGDWGTGASAVPPAIG
ncbi:GH92 family glycosyl hydrolase [Streptomyces sp. UNOB3_S3]|uniref:GH92 family glycosyl hydrolase n=1 Tax=Streptomyces sp. UNOB3_S3 TaxID=2871682 RepID=UPI001E62A198|nr:GH92 family glycosyl hydrolase [Streptomyces sp. UNOB3_S3]MCC3773685.1 GH92 family glycosyl hydrolase [Streptomyces sp. UNOB3_S3]